MVENALIGTTEFDIFSLNPATCAVNWRTHEDYPPALLPSNRGAAYLDGMLFRGTQDGRVLAYDFKTGKRIWETTIADPKRGESVPSAPIACGRPRLRRQCGRRLQGREGPYVRARREDRQDRLGVLSGSQGRGRHRPRTAGRDAARRIDLEECAGPSHQRWRNLDVLHARHENRAALRPRRQSGPRFRRSACARETIPLPTRSSCSTPRPATTRTHFKIVQKDWHDWDVSNPPILIQTMGGKQLMAVAPKDGYLYGFDLADQRSALPRAGDPGRGCHRTLFARHRCPFLPGLGGGRGMEQPGLRSAGRT